MPENSHGDITRGQDRRNHPPRCLPARHPPEDAATMAALSTGTYGKGTTMTTAVEYADRISKALELAYDALDTLDRGVQTGTLADQGSINTLRKVIQDMGTIAGDARKQASDEAAQSADEKVAAAGPGSGDGDDSDDAGTAKGSTAKSTPSGSSGGRGGDPGTGGGSSAGSSKS